MKNLNNKIISIALLISLIVSAIPFDLSGLLQGNIFKREAKADITTGLTGHWKFDEGSGITTADSSGNGKTGTLTNGPTWTTTGKIGGALQFDGVDDYVNILDATDPTAYTISAWVKSNSVLAQNIFVRTDASGPTGSWSHQLRMTSGSGIANFVHYTYTGSLLTITGSTTISAGTWYHVVAVAQNNGGTLSPMRLYVNGVEEGTAITNVGTLWTGGDQYRIGSNSGHAMGYFNGTIDDVRIYNRALTSTDIQELFNFTGTPSETTPPTVSITSPTSGTTVSGTITVSADASDNVGVAGVTFKVDGATIGSEDTTSPYSISWNTGAVTNGSHTLTAVARDTSGNTSTSSSVSVTVDNPADTTAPTVSISSPVSGSVVSGTITVSANASDNVAVAGVQFKLDGVNLGAEDTTSPYSISWDTKTVADGSHTLSAVARDGAGNTAASSTVTITASNGIDTTPPTVKVTSPINNSTVTGFLLALSADASDNIGVSTVEFSTGGGGLGPGDTTAPYTFKWDLGETSLTGSNKIIAKAIDAKGNSATDEVTFNWSPGSPGISTISSGSYQLTVYDAALNKEVLTNAPVTFYAEFKNSNVHMAGANCTITFTESSWASSWTGYVGEDKDHVITTVTMTDTGSNYSYTRSFDSPQIQRAIVKCSKGAINLSIGNLTTVNFPYEAVKYNRILTSDETNRLINPEDIEYMGAFQPPAVSEPGFGRYGFGLSGLTFYPNGDPTGNDDYPGSLFGTGHISGNKIAEMSIPMPAVLVNKKRPNKYTTELPIANHLQPFVEPKGTIETTLTLYGIQYLPMQGLQSSNKIYFGYNSGYPSGADDRPSTGWANINLSDLQPQGMWYVSGYQYPTVSRTLFEIPKEWADTYASGKLLATGRSGGSINARWSHGPAIIAISPWNDGNPPAPNSTLSSKTLLNYPAWTNDIKDWNWGDEIWGGAWLTVGNKSTIIFNRDKSVGDFYYIHATGKPHPWHTQLIFYDPNEIAQVAQGLKTSYEPQPYLVLRLRDYIILPADSTKEENTDSTAGLGGLSFDRSKGLIYLAQTDLGESPAIHVFQITDKCRKINKKKGINGVAKLEIWDDVICSVETNTSVNFSANYTNSGSFVSGAVCSATFSDTGSLAMSEVAGQYKLSRSFSSTGKFKYNMSCSKSGVSPVNIDGVVIVTSGGVITADTSVPTVSITSPTTGSTVSGAVTVSATASDNVNVAGVQFRLDAVNLGTEDTTSPYSISWDTTTATNGSHTLTAVARDAAGNTTTSSPITVTVSNAIDTTLPVISGVVASSITSTGATITWTTNENSDSQVEYGITTAYGSSTVLNTSFVTSHSESLSGLSPSTLYNYRVKSKDAQSNLATSGNFTFTTNTAADTTPPTVSISSPLNNSTVTGSITLVADASDNIGIAGVQFKLDGNNLGTEDPSSPYSISWSTTLATNGSHTLTAVARDAAGNVTTSTAVTVTVSNDITPPTISNVQTTSITTTSATITWTTNEAADSRVEYGLTTSYGNLSPLDPNMTINHSVLLSGLSPGTTFHYRVISKDSIGNISNSINFTFNTLSDPTSSDTTRPAKINNLAAKTVIANSVIVAWTAPGDDGLVGQAFKYDLRYSRIPITEANFLDATSFQATGVSSPKVSGQGEEYTLIGLSNDTTYYFAIKTKDEVGNISDLSNVISVKTQALTISGEEGRGSGGGGVPDTTPPKPVSKATIQSGDSQVFISWENPLDIDFAKNLVIRRQTSPFDTSSFINCSVFRDPNCGQGQTVFLGLAQELIDLGLENGQAYYYAIFALDNNANQSEPRFLKGIPEQGKLSFVDPSALQQILPFKEGEVIQFEGKTEFYLVEQNRLRLIASEDILLSHSYSTGSVRLLEKEEFSFSDFENKLGEALELKKEPITIFSFSLPLSSGFRSDEVKKLQELLSKDPDIYPEKTISGYYGSLTRAAVIRFQREFGLTPNGTLNESTLKKMSEAFKAKAAVSSQINRNLSRGFRGDDVKFLQELLIKEDVYPEKLTTGFYGSLTQKAVVAFQKKHNISPALGSVGPLTRKKIDELSVKGPASVTAIRIIPYFDNTLIKQENTETIYLLKNQQLNPIPSLAILKSQGLSKKSIKIITEKDFQNLANLAPISQALTYSDNTLIRKGIGQPIYIIKNTQKQLIPNLKILYSHGFFESQVITISDQEFEQIPTNPLPLIPNVFPDGTLLKALNSNYIYLVFKSGLFLIPTNAVFQQKGYQTKDIKVVHPGALKEYDIKGIVR